MGEEVAVEVPFLNPCHGTQVALVGPDSRMEAHVGGQDSLFGESLEAVGALVRSVCAVGPLVGHHPLTEQCEVVARPAAEPQVQGVNVLRPESDVVCE